MTRRNHGDIPPLRAGCFPQDGLPNPPHLNSLCGDNLLVRIIPVRAYDELPAITVPEGQTTLTSGEPLMEAVTPNGWRCYLRTTDTESLLTLLNLASAGDRGIQLWMRGHDYADAYAEAEKAREAREERRREAQRRHSHYPSIDEISLNDIEI